MNAINKTDGVHYTQQTMLFHGGVLQSKHNSFKNVTDLNNLYESTIMQGQRKKIEFSPSWPAMLRLQSSNM